MASVTLASLVEGVVQPGSTATGSQKRFITSLGPMKIEWNIFLVDSDADVFTVDDTFVSKLVTPIAAGVIPVNSNLAGTAFDGSVELNTDPASATYRTVTLRSITETAVDGVLVVVIGF